MTLGSVRILHYLNQFFAGIGGEEQAGVPVELWERVVGLAIGLQQQLGEAGSVVGTLLAGDDYMAQHQEQADERIREAIHSVRPDCLVAGPAFNSGRYGLACGRVCRIATELGIPAVTAMFPGNPAVDFFREQVWILPAQVSARGMREALPRLVDFALRLCSGQPLGRPEEEGYLPRGVRLNRVTSRTGALRAVGMLSDRLRGLPFQTEVPVRSFEAIQPAPPVADLSQARLVLLSTGGVVPMGNPDRLKHVNESRWCRYSIEGLASLEADQWEPIHGGFDASHARRNPNVIVPLDELRALERESRIVSIFEKFYSVVGVGASSATCRQVGDEIAADIMAEGVSGVILTST